MRNKEIEGRIEMEAFVYAEEGLVLGWPAARICENSSHRPSSRKGMSMCTRLREFEPSMSA
jgi:hypothetical protein